jgi:hypothetical protein
VVFWTQNFAKMLHRMVMGDVANVSEVHTASIFRVATCTSKMSTTIWCNNQRTELTPLTEHCGSLKSIISNVWDKHFAFSTAVSSGGHEVA